MFVKGQWESVQEPVGCLDRNVIIRPYSIRIHHVSVGEDIGWRAGHHGRLQARITTILHDVKCSICWADDSNRLANQI